MAKKQKKSKRKNQVALSFLRFLGIVAALCLVLFLSRKCIYRIPMPEGQIRWTTERPDSAQLCVAAAYSDKDGNILGQYIIDGRMHNNVRQYNARTSIKDGMFYVDYKWLSNNGFQQHSLVIDGQPKRFTDTRYRMRRALCKRDGKVFIAQSLMPMTMTDFARKCAGIASNAVNLDMGHMSYGHTTLWGMRIPLGVWAWSTQQDQTNWIYIK